MFKLAAFAVIISVTSFLGNNFAYLLKKRVVTLKKMNYLIDEIIILLRYKASTVYEISSHLSSDTRFSDFVFLQSISQTTECSFQQNWCSAVEKQKPDSLGKEDISVLCDIGRKLGTSDLEGQISTLKLQQSEVETLILSAESEYNRKAKLYRSLGVLSGAFVVVMLI